jgi:chemotaxis protein methyltransferase CheR
MIYFDDVLKLNVLRLFHGCLGPGGFFVIGYYDAMPDGYGQFFELYDPNTKTYRRVP